MDIAELILTDHGRQRRSFALLDEMGRSDTTALAAVWDRLRIMLEVHAEAEEEVFYPELLSVGIGAGSKDSAAAEAEDAIDDHNEIRDAITEVDRCDVGTESWWEAVAGVRKANSDHMGEEERQALADFRRHADLRTRHDLGTAFLAFESTHAGGVESEDEDAEQYVSERS